MQKNKKSIHKRSFIFSKKIFKLKFCRSSKNHLLLNKNKFSKSYMRRRSFFNKFNIIKKMII